MNKGLIRVFSGKENWQWIKKKCSEIILLEPKRQKLDGDADEKLAENVSRTKRLTQLKKDIAILEAAIRRGQETMEKMLNIAVEDMTIDPLVRIQVCLNLEKYRR